MPSSPEAESALIGCILLDNSVLDSVIPRLSPAAFYQHRNGIIYKTMMQLNEAGTPIDIISIRDELDMDINILGGVAYLSQCQNETPSALNWESYARIVGDKYKLREVLHRTYSIQKIINDSQSDGDVLEEIEKTLTELTLSCSGDDFVPMRAAIKKAVKAMEAAHESGGIAGVPTGFASLDNLTTGLKSGAMIVLAARPSLGKTTLAMNIATNVAERVGPVGVFSLEMNDEELAQRAICSSASTNGRKMMAGELSSGDLKRVMSSLTRTSSLPVYFEAKGGLTPAELRSKARQMKVRHGVKLIVVDYLQLMRGKGKSRYEQVTEVSQAIKQTAMELGIPVLVLSQLNRDADQETPRLSMLRESGSIEQDADMVWMLNRPDKSSNIMELMVMKNRQGPTAVVKLEFIPEHYRFQTPNFNLNHGMD